MLKIGRRLLTSVSRINNTNINIEVSFSFADSNSIYLTIYDKDIAMNCTFTVYDFLPRGLIDEHIKQLVDVMKQSTYNLVDSKVRELNDARFNSWRV